MGPAAGNTIERVGELRRSDRGKLSSNIQPMPPNEDEEDAFGEESVSKWPDGWVYVFKGVSTTRLAGALTLSVALRK